MPTRAKNRPKQRAKKRSVVDVLQALGARRRAERAKQEKKLATQRARALEAGHACRCGEPLLNPGQIARHKCATCWNAYLRERRALGEQRWFERRTRERALRRVESELAETEDRLTTARKHPSPGDAWYLDRLKTRRAGLVQRKADLQAEIAGLAPRRAPVFPAAKTKAKRR
jgi:hypothetical protein